MLKLGVNIDHVATLREARYRGRDYGEPDPMSAAQSCVAAGAHGITVHLREDRRQRNAYRGKGTEFVDLDLFTRCVSNRGH